MSSELRSVIPVWLVAVAGAVAVAILAPSALLMWLPLVMAGAILLTFVIQLAVSRKEGLVERIVASLGGALVVLVLATGALVAVGLATSTTADSCACTHIDEPADAAADGEG